MTARGSEHIALATLLIRLGSSRLPILDPILTDLAEEYDGMVKFVKIDTEENFDTPARYGILGLPAILVFKDGKKVDEIRGLRPTAELKNSLDKALV